MDGDEVVDASAQFGGLRHTSLDQGGSNVSVSGVTPSDAGDGADGALDFGGQLPARGSWEQSESCGFGPARGGIIHRGDVVMRPELVDVDGISGS